MFNFLPEPYGDSVNNKKIQRREKISIGDNGWTVKTELKYQTELTNYQICIEYYIPVIYSSTEGCGQTNEDCESYLVPMVMYGENHGYWQII